MKRGDVGLHPVGRKAAQGHEQKAYGLDVLEAGAWAPPAVL